MNWAANALRNLGGELELAAGVKVRNLRTDGFAQAEVAKRFVQPVIASAMNLRALQFNFQRSEALRLFGA